ncbi:hypothetical protein MKW94_004500 [Papaver nudicaule]|uniref:Solute carrier family 35 member F1 n=1 Tax=Papaver nudicaule TaxID=74823 RepID=A0AA41SGH8_PAPNU|nr:hypothetical protein [Papaver nudicaule]
MQKRLKFILQPHTKTNLLSLYCRLASYRHLAVTFTILDKSTIIWNEIYVSTPNLSRIYENVRINYKNTEGSVHLDNLFYLHVLFVLIIAYQYTSLTSVMLLDCWTIPCVILFTWLFLKTKYRVRKFVGVAFCVAGLVLVVFSDVHASDRAGGSHPIKGDLLVIAGATLYGVTNTSEEFLVKNVDRVEVMAMLGLFGAIISAIQIAILERKELKAIHWSAGALLPYSGFAAAMFLFYSTVPVLLQISGSTMLNLSLLTSDMWAVLIRIFAYHEKVDWMYFIAFAGVVVGLVIYSGGSKKEENNTQVAAGGESTVIIDEEAGITDPHHGSSTVKV